MVHSINVVVTVMKKNHKLLPMDLIAYGYPHALVLGQVKRAFHDFLGKLGVIAKRLALALGRYLRSF